MLGLSPIAGAPIAAPIFNNPASALDVYAAEYVRLKKKAKSKEPVLVLDDRLEKAAKKPRLKELAEFETVRQTLEKVVRPPQLAPEEQEEAEAAEERRERESAKVSSPLLVPLQKQKPVSPHIFAAPVPELPIIAMATPQEIEADDADVIALILAEEQAMLESFMKITRMHQWPFH